MVCWGLAWPVSTAFPPIGHSMHFTFHSSHHHAQELQEDKVWVIWFTAVSPTLAQALAHSGSSESICRFNECVSHSPELTWPQLWGGGGGKVTMY